MLLRRGPQNDDPHADRSEHRVERSGELGVPVTPGQEHAPGLSGPGCGIDARVLENLPRRRRRELISKAGEFAVDAPVTPARLSCAISSTSARTACAVRGRPGVRRG
jgi:hypothetical protein